MCKAAHHLRCVLFCTLLFILSANASALASDVAPTPPNNAEVTALLQRMGEAAQTVQSVNAQFTQKKQLSFLQQPLQSYGNFSFVRYFGSTQSPAILWEYTSPARSGLWFRGGEGFFWVNDLASIHKAKGQENAILSAMVEQMLLWFSVEPQKLQNAYVMSILPPKKREGEEKTQDHCLRLVPKETQFFSAMNVCLRSDLRALTSLRFEEPEGDTCTLFFNDIVLNAQPLTAFSDGTALP